MDDKRNRGRAAELASELDSLIEQLKAAQAQLEATGRSPTVDLSTAIGNARHVRDLLDGCTTTNWSVIRDAVSFLTKVAKEIHSMLNCYFTRVMYS